MIKPDKDISVYMMLDRIRKHLGLTIDQFCFEMNWPGSNYYDAIKSGYKRPDGVKKPLNPTVHKIFDGINYAIANYEHWRKEASTITSIVVEELLVAPK